MMFINNLLKGSQSLLMANLGAKMLSVLVLPLLTAWLSPALYGEAALASTLISLVSMLFLAGMDMSYSRAYFGVPGAGTDQVELLLWRVSVVSGLLGGLLAATFWWWYSDVRGLHRELTVLIFLGVLGSVMVAMAQTRARLLQNYQRIAIVTALAAVLSYALMLFLAKQTELQIFALVSGYVSIYWLVLAGLQKPPRAMLRDSVMPETKVSRSILYVGLPGIVTAPAYWVLASSDRWFLSAHFDTSTVGAYAIAVSFGTLGMMLNNAVLSAWVPEIVRHSENRLSYREIVQAKVLVLSAYAWVWLAISLLSPLAIQLLVDDRFHAAIALVPWLAGGVFFYGCYHLFNSSLYLDRKLSVSAYGAVISILVVLAGMAYAVPRFGMQGAAVAQCLGFAAYAGFVGWWARANLVGLLTNLRFWFGLLCTAGCYQLTVFIPDTGFWSVILLLAVLAISMAILIGLHHRNFGALGKGRAL